MFSQWRQAVESLAQPRASQDSPTDEHHTRSSLDIGLRSPLSSSQLAESALSNLKKTLVTPRSGSPGPSRSSISNSPDAASKQPGQRTTLEDRLRAKLAAKDVSSSSTPTDSARASPTPPDAAEQSLSPASTPLPESPSLHTAGMRDPLDALSSPPVMMRVPRTDIKQGSVHNGSPHSRKTSMSLTSAVQHTLSPTSTSLPDSPVSQPMPTSLVSEDSEVRSLSSLPETDSMSLRPDILTEELAGSISRKPESPSAAISSETIPSDRVVSPASDSLTDVDSRSDQRHVLAVNEAGSIDTPLSDQVVAENAVHPDGVASDVSVTEDEPSPTKEETSYNEDPIQVDDTPRNAIQSATTLTSGDESEDVSQASALASHEPLPKDNHESTTTEASAPGTQGDEPDIEALQRRLKLVEQRFADVSTSFKRLQAEKIAADKVLQELTPVESMQDVDGIRDYLQNMNLKTEMSQDEIKRLTGKLTRQEERIEELRDIHRLESKSQSDQIDKLKGQLDETEALLKASQASNSQVEEESAKRKAEIDRLHAEVERVNGVAKEEEEKRVKAIALLKTVRQKLVKAEKEREDALRETHAMKEKEKEERERNDAEKQDLRREIERLNEEKDATVKVLKTHFEKEAALLRDKHDKELSALRGQFELEAMSTKSSYTRELETKTSRISELQSSVHTLEVEKDEFFYQLQLRQAELESSRSRLESLESQTTEFRYQLREANDRIALLTEELSDARREHETKALTSGPSAEEVTRLLSAAEVKYESRIGDLRRRLSAIERERDEGEAEWSRKLSEKVKELDSLRGVLNSSTRSREEESESANMLKREIEALKDEIQTYQNRIVDLQVQSEKVTEAENAAKAEKAEYDARLAALQQLVEEAKGREAQLRAHNKTMREELRKVQSSAALLERQRNPGVGYWASRQESSSDIRSPRSSVSDLTMRDSSSRPGSPATDKSDEEINVEYLRNVILQFLEHTEMRPHLVRILSTILRFTPQETRRLISKV